MEFNEPTLASGKTSGTRFTRRRKRRRRRQQRRKATHLKRQLHCFQDQCPHRLAKLSEGQVIDGKLECLCHGWQFNGSGQCTKIPQLEPGAKIPKTTCTKTYAVKVS